MNFRIVVDYLPHKEYPYHTHLTAGGNLINYPGNVVTPTAYMITSKLLFNSLLLTPYVKFMGTDMKIIYVNTPMDRYEYMRLPIKIIPQDIIDKYQLMNKLKMASSCVKSHN